MRMMTMTEYRVSPVSEFSKDLNRIEDLLDDLECYDMFPQWNPGKKKDVILSLRLIRNQADEMIRRTQQTGYDYFTEPTEDKP